MTEANTYVGIDLDDDTYHRYVHPQRPGTACGLSLEWCTYILFLNDDLTPCPTCWPELQPATTLTLVSNQQPKEPT